MEYGRASNLSRDGWMEERCLGAGGFGTVMLYENKVYLTCSFPIFFNDFPFVQV